MSINIWISEMWYINTMENYLTIKRSKVTMHTTTWMNLENITFHKRSELQKTTYLYLYGSSRTGKSTETKYISGHGGLGLGGSRVGDSEGKLRENGE